MTPMLHGMVRMNTTKKNVLFLITHDVGPVYGCYGNHQIHSPNVDHLARESVQFDSHFCQWPLCGPSRANLFTGCRPLTTQRYNNQPFFNEFRTRAPAGFASLPEKFSHHGWRSHGIGFIYHDEVDETSWTEGHRKPAPITDPLPPWAEGWFTSDELYEWKAPGSRELIRERLEALKDSGMTPGEFRKRENIRRARGPAFESAEVDDEDYYDGKTAHLACRFLEEYPEPMVKARSSQSAEQEPYFLVVGFVAPHTPFRAPSRYWDLYDSNALSLHPNRDWPIGSADWMAGDSEPAQYYTTNGYSKPWRPNDAQLRELLHGHYATISYLDALIGKILEAAKIRSDWDNTIVVVTSDHGFSEGQHGYLGKHNMWDASLRIPLLLRIPGQRGFESRIRRVTEHADVYPTLSEIAGIPVPGYCEGRSFLSLLSNPEADWKDTAISHRKPMWHDRLQVYDWCSSIRTPSHRYTEYLDQNGLVLGRELFDYVRDPLESRNRADDADHEAVRQALSWQLHQAVQRPDMSL